MTATDRIILVGVIAVIAWLASAVAQGVQANTYPTTVQCWNSDGTGVDAAGNAVCP
jgi:uncharacterized membrane protein